MALPGTRADPLAGLIARLDPTNLDFTDLDLDRFVRSLPSSPGAAASKLTDLAREVTYVTVGLGILNFQRAQVRRRELERRLQR
jgi:hypothetical protein